MSSVGGRGTREPVVPLWPLAFSVGYLAGFFLSTAIATPLLWYLPVERSFVWAVHPSGVAADFYGRVLLSLAGGGVCAGLCLGLERAFGPGGTRWLHRLTVWLVCLFVLTGGLYVSTLAKREPIPAPLPKGYVRR